MSYSKSEEDIVMLAQNGDNDAITEIIKSYRKVITRKSRTFYLSGGEQEDLIQEGSLGVLNAIKNFDESKNIKFTTFANLCITRQMLTAIKSANRDKYNILNNAYSLNKLSKSINDEEFELMDMIIDKNTLSPEDIYISNEGVSRIFQSIETNLSEFEKSVLTQYLNGESYSDIAIAFKKDKKAIDNALQRIRKKLDKVIEWGILWVIYLKIQTKI